MIAMMTVRNFLCILWLSGLDENICNALTMRVACVVLSGAAHNVALASNDNVCANPRFVLDWSGAGVSLLANVSL
jgi:hypothetical protein